jgi:hypothetical protein
MLMDTTTLLLGRVTPAVRPGYQASRQWVQCLQVLEALPQAQARPATSPKPCREASNNLHHSAQPCRQARNNPHARPSLAGKPPTTLTPRPSLAGKPGPTPTHRKSLAGKPWPTSPVVEALPARLGRPRPSARACRQGWADLDPRPELAGKHGRMERALLPYQGEQSPTTSRSGAPSVMATGWYE